VFKWVRVALAVVVSQMAMALYYVIMEMRVDRSYSVQRVRNRAYKRQDMEIIRCSSHCASATRLRAQEARVMMAHVEWQQVVFTNFHVLRRQSGALSGRRRWDLVHGPITFQNSYINRKKRAMPSRENSTHGFAHACAFACNRSADTHVQLFWCPTSSASPDGSIVRPDHAATCELHGNVLF
jgi:hypothetical protein